jgi:thiol-disulfide isomerase/thioredoxin
VVGRLKTLMRIAAPGAALVLALALTSCSAGEDGGGGAPEDFNRALERAPDRLSWLYETPAIGALAGQGDFEATLSRLRGFPVVVNNWASWCGPCREEFPMFQAQAAKRLDQVAFLGVLSEDSSDAASTFLRDHPVPYPSVDDPDGELGTWIDRALVGLPNTLFYDGEGTLVYVKQGPYSDEKDLASDIERYAQAR